MMHNLDISVKIEPSKLIEALERNKEKHLLDYTKAVTVYFEEIRTELQKRLDKVPSEDLKFDFNLHMQKPIDNTKEYDKYIGMFKLASDESIVLSASEYDSIVNDNWSWAVAATASNAMYSSKFRG